MKPTKQKVFAYITHHHHLLVFRHPYAPEAGIQVPAGTIEENEHPDEAVLREAFEETGLSDLVLNCFLGEQKRDMADFGRDETHQRFFYHLQYNGNPPSNWRHEEQYDSTDSNLMPMPIIFEFFWVSLSHGVPPLIADHGIMLPRLLEVISLKET
jgi:8-oxo-dGTP diphosphatase